MADRNLANVCAIRRPSDGYYWERNIEHGSGWTWRIRQTWTPREADLEVEHLFARGECEATDVQVVEVVARGGESG